MPKQKQDGQLGETRELPPGVKLVRTLEGHDDVVCSVAFDPAGQTLASGSADRTVKLWDVTSGKLLRTLGYRGLPPSIAARALPAPAPSLASGRESAPRRPSGAKCESSRKRFAKAGTREASSATDNLYG